MSLLLNEVDAFPLQLSLEQLSLLGKLQQWVETEADFYGRSEEDFLVLFLRSCNFDLEQSKKSLCFYYQARIKNPEWWFNRDINQPQIQFFVKKRVATILMDTVGGSYPTVVVIRVSRFGSDSSLLAPAMMYVTFGMDILVRKPNCQLNGCIFICDYNNCPWWLLWKLLWPPLVRNVFNSCLLCMPIKVKAAVLVNGPAITSSLLNVFRSILPNAFRNKVHCCKSWSDIGQFVSLELLPDEFGGCAGPIKVHEDASANELLAMRDYILDDNKYGFQSK